MARRSTRLCAYFAAAASAPLMLAANADAQTATSPTPATAAPAKGAPAKAGSTEVGEIVVTATRQSQVLSKVAESVSAFTAAKMQVMGIKSFDDVVRYTPGVAFDQDSHDIAIRGISSTAGSGTTGIYIDDTPVQVRNLGLNANNTLPSVFDLQRVEVLRGPQGTLFGAGSEGGTVRYITTQPSLTTWSAMAHSEFAWTVYGDPSYEAGATIGGPIVNDKLGFEVSAWGRKDGGWIDRVNYQTGNVTDANANYVDTYTLRAALTWAPTSNITITPAINYQDRYQNNYDNYNVYLSHPGDGYYVSSTPDQMADQDAFYLPTLRMEYDTHGVKLISNTAYYDRKEVVNGYSGTIYNLSYFQQIISGGLPSPPPYPTVPLPPGTIGTDPQGNPCANNCQNQYPLLTPTGPNLPSMPNYNARNFIHNLQSNWTQEFRIQSADPNARFTWVSGLFLARDTQRSTETIWDPELPALTQQLWGESMLEAWGEELLPGGLDYINDTQAKDTQEALFANATFLVTPQLKLIGGLRYAWTHFDFSNLNDGPQDLLDNGGVPAVTGGSKDENPLTPMGSVSYQITHDDMVYATAAKGYRIGGATPPLPVQACGAGYPTSYDSDSLWSYEIGSKDRFFDRRLQISGSAFFIDWSNIQQAFYVPSCGIQFTTNAGTVYSKGFDMQSQFQVTHALDLEMTVGYTDAYFAKTALDASGDVLDKPGDTLDIPPWTATFAAEYKFRIADQYDAFARVDYSFTSQRTKPIPNEDPRTAFYDAGLRPDPATNLVNLRIGATLQKWDLEMYLNNVLNSHPQLSLQHQDQWTTLYEAQTFRPLTLGLSATYKY
jgi:outer membrane receptor protein involved in Fe transport